MKGLLKMQLQTEKSNLVFFTETIYIYIKMYVKNVFIIFCTTRTPYILAKVTDLFEINDF